jgi:deoxyguanosine kinase
MTRIYISTGSNLGDRLGFLQQGLDAVAQHIGKVLKVSSVIETSALGFDGNSFLNACFLVETQMKADEVLEKLLEIEKQHGRKRSSAKGYKNRTLDLDLLFYDDEIVQTKNLTLPHPQLQNRRFVLQPLAEIASNTIHPVLQKTVAVLLKSCDDNTPITIHKNGLEIS